MADLAGTHETWVTCDVHTLRYKAVPEESQKHALTEIKQNMLRKGRGIHEGLPREVTVSRNLGFFRSEICY